MRSGKRTDRKRVKPIKKSKKHRRARLLLLLVLLLAGWVWWGNNALSVEEYTFTSPDLPSGWDGVRIVNLTDLHGKEFGRDNHRLLDAVREAKPEYIFLTGDMADQRSGIDDMPALFTGLVDIAPVYFVTGNHEWGDGLMPDLIPMMREYGVYYLNNMYVPLQRNGDTIFLAGVDDPNGYADQKTPEELTAELYAAEGDPFWLLLAHRNNLFPGKYCRLGADLTIVGHGHGGIWRFPGTDGFIDHEMQLFPSWTDGFYTCTAGDCQGSTVFVNRGLGNSSLIPRLFNRPEVAVLTLKTAP